MNRVLAILPLVVISTYMTIGGVVRFDPGVMRIVSPVLLLIIGPAVYAASRRGRATALDKALVAYIALAAAGFSVWPEGLGAVSADYASALLYSFLFVAAAGPPLLGLEPFTAQFARRIAPPAVWETDIFKEINRRLNLVWAAIFAGCVTSSLLPALSVVRAGLYDKMLWEVLAPLVLVLGVGLPVTKYYPDHYVRKSGLRPKGDSAPPAGPEPAELAPRPQPGALEEYMDGKRKVVAINGSPQEGVSNISQMIAMLAKAFEEEGFETEEIFLNRQRIEYCTGCAFCLEKGSCWIKDDHKKVMKKVLDADVVILGSPVYFYHVTGQMKTFLDRSLAYGHKPLRTWKPGLAVSVAAAFGEVSTAEYLGRILPVYGAFEVGRLTALATGPGEFMGRELVEARAADLARDVVRAVKEERRYPATEHDLYYWSLIGGLVKENRDFMKADDDYWREHGLYDGFEAFIGQERSPSVASPETREAWLKGLIKRQTEKRKSRSDRSSGSRPRAGTARELLEMMPSALSPEASDGLDATYQFEVSGSENFTAHIRIADRKATFHEGPAEKPDVTVKTPADVWLAIGRGEQDGAQAFMSGKYTVEGDLNLLMKLGGLFPGKR
jgi:multimeric flavodoxin WrbA/putative sterol carrier protein